MASFRSSLSFIRVQKPPNATCITVKPERLRVSPRVELANHGARSAPAAQGELQEMNFEVGESVCETCDADLAAAAAEASLQVDAAEVERLMEQLQGLNPEGNDPGLTRADQERT